MNGDRQSSDVYIETRIPTINLQHLRYATIAADLGSFRQAAEIMLLRQSTLSRCIRQLENSIGMTIFERSSGGVHATESGRSFLYLARSILEQVNSLVTMAYRTGSGQSGRLSIGFYTSLSAGNLRATLVEFARRFSEIQCGMIERSRARLVTGLRNGALDVVIVTGEADFGSSNKLRLWSERILVALPKGHPLAERQVVYWTDLSSETVLLSSYDPGRELEALLMSKLPSLGDQPKIERQDVSRGIIKSLVSVGFGISLVTESDIGVNFSDLTYRELRDGASSGRIDYSAHWRPDNPNPALVHFLNLLRERYPSPSA